MSELKVGIIEINKRKYFTVIDVKDNELNIEIAEDGVGSRSWSGHFDSSSISNWVGKTRLSTEKYISEAIAALSGNSTDCHYIVELKDEELSWKKRLSEDEILFKMGSVKLRRTETVSHMLRVCVESVNSLQNELTQVRSVKDALESEHTQLLRRLEECSSAKQRMEVELYSKFAEVLNEKKRKIRELQQQPKSKVEPKPIETVKKPAVKREKSPDEVEFVLDSGDNESQDLEPIKPSSSRSKRRLLSPPAQTEKDPDDDYMSETLPMDSEELLTDFD